MKKIVLFLSLLCAFGFEAAAQKSVSLSDLRNNIAAMKNNRRYRLVYAKDVDRSLVFSLLPAPQRGTFASPETAIPLNVGFDFEGNSFAGTRDEFVIFFHSLGLRRNFLKNETLGATVDGERVELGRSEPEKTFKEAFLNGKRTEESLVFRISRAELEKISAAREVEIRLSDLFYKLGPQDLEHLKNLLAISKSGS